MIEWEGMDEFQQALHKYPDVALKSLRGSMYRGAEKMMTDSKQNYVPIDLGTLKGSGHVKQPKTKGTRVWVVMGFGGAASAYALAQHERMDYQHKTGGPKYLERPVNKAKKQLAKDIQKNLHRDMGRVT